MPHRKTNDGRSLRILAADPDPAMKDFYAAALPRLGHQLVHFSRTGEELIEKCRALRPDLVIVDAQLPDMDGSAAEEVIGQEFAAPLIVTAAGNQTERACQGVDGRVLACLIKPLHSAQLEVQIPLVMRWFEQMESLRQEIAACQQDGVTSTQ